MINHPQFIEQEGDGTFYVEGDEYVAESNIKGVVNAKLKFYLFNTQPDVDRGSFSDPHDHKTFCCFEEYILGDLPL